jgi:hypothetical protein
MKIIKWTFGILGLGIVFIIGYYVFGFFTFISGFPDASYTKQDLIDNYELKHNEINELHLYINRIVPANKRVDIEFENDRKFFIFHVVSDDVYDSNWEIDISSGKTDSLLTNLGWTRETLKTLKRKLDNANCISIESGEPTTIGYQRSGMGQYFYKVFAKPLADSLRNQYNDGCTHIFYKDNIVLEYGGGAIGPQCFETFKYPE